MANGTVKWFNDAKGFGFLGKEINYYAPTSVFVLLTYLANHIYSIGANLSKFVLAATMCGLEINSGHLTMENQLDIAYRITKVATES